MKWQPHKYQERAVDFLLERSAAALFMDMGLGKTSTVLTAFNTLKYDMGLVNSLVVVAPLRVALLVWAQEAAKWDHLQHLRIQILHGNGKEPALDKNADVYVINYDGLKWLSGRLKKSKLIKKMDMVAFDESTMAKNPSAKRSKICMSMAMLAKRRVIMTGTPIPNKLTDIWHQVKLLDMGERLGTTFTGFKQRWFFTEGYGGYTLVPFKGASKEITQKISDLALTMKAEDYLNMPDKIDNVVKVELPAQHRDQYEEFEREFFLQVEDEGIEVFNAASLSIKLRQFVQGFVYNTETNGAVNIHDCKVQALREIVDGSGSPILVAVQFRHEVELLRKEFGDVPVIHGGTSTKDSVDYVDRWNKGEIPMLLAHPASLAHGVNLQAGGHTVVWFSFSYNLEHYIQFNARLYRQGQTRSVLIHHIVMQDTIDEVVMATIGRKEMSQEKLLTRMKEYRDARKGSGTIPGQRVPEARVDVREVYQPQPALSA